MKKYLLTILSFGLALSFSAKADEARLLRFPATNGTDIVFSYAGDLFSAPLAGGEAKRLTSHIGYEMFAKYSPDGKTIAFTGEYDGNREVYIIPATGGEPVRLTYTSTNSRDDLGDRMGPNNIVMAWTNDGKYIVYRNRTGDGFPGKLWKVSVNGGMPEEIPLPEGGFCSFSPDGKKLAYNRVMREFRTWKYYRGGMADEVWVYDGKSVEKITDNAAQDIFPMWVGNEIYFVSDRDMNMNIFVYNTSTKATSKVTNFSDFDVKFPSTNGKLVVFEKGGFLYKLDPATKKAEQIHITLTSDVVYSRPELKKVTGRGFSVSPDGKRAAVTARGEVFDVPVGKGITRNITQTPGANERGASWSPDGKYIAYISDKTGENEVYLYEAATGTTVQATKDNDTYISNLMWAPDSKHIYYTDRKNRLVEVDPATKSKKVVYSSPEGGLYGVSFSPDSKWIAYTRPASNDMSIVYVHNLATGKAYPVTEKWYSSGSPMFSSDGKYLIFTSERDLTPTYSRIEWNYSYGSMSGTYMAMLAKDTPSPLLPTDSETNVSTGDSEGTDASAARPERPGAPAGPGAKPGEKPGEKKVAETKIDPDGLIDRVVKLPISGRVFFCDGKKLWFTGGAAPMGGARGGMGGGAGAGVKTYDFASGKTEDCTDGMISYRLGDKKAVLSSRGKSTVVNFPSPRVAGGEEIDADNMYATIDYSQEWPQVYNEVWRAFRDGYYVENMHGRDWKGVKAKYEPLLPYVKTRLDLNYLLGAMISELASGHAYVNPGPYPKPDRIPMGLLGAKLSKDKGYFKIDHIYAGATYRPELRSPLTEPGMNINEGDYITAINGQSLKDVDNIYKCLIGKADKLVELTVNSKAAEGGRKVVVKPISNEYPLEHYEWIMKNIKTVEEKSGGKVGYIYIPDMGAEGLNEFARYWYPQLDKEALIIDDRENGGGNVSPMIIERLQRVVYRMNAGRGSNRVNTIPDGAHVGPKVLLINKYSASDGDLFPWGFKANKLGTVIGTRTWGGIVGIGGSLPYMDGTDVRVPGSTSFDPYTGEWIIENYGVDPDIVLDNDPVKEYAGTDQQLLKAIEVALEQIKTQRSHKDLPAKPAPRTFKDLGLPEIK
ncbi:MAG: PD40 domain-containing protein [Bacteroidales bacterium]|nr:PD40 domain-containing protein [Bacteroidales bacterium]